MVYHIRFDEVIVTTTWTSLENPTQYFKEKRERETVITRNISITLQASNPIDFYKQYGFPAINNPKDGISNKRKMDGNI